MKKFVCQVCGYVYEGEAAPAKCPQCGAPASKFQEMAAEMGWAAEHVVGIASDVPEDIKADLRANFNGECSEVGMYLAMSRVSLCYYISVKGTQAVQVKNKIKQCNIKTWRELI